MRKIFLGFCFGLLSFSAAAQLPKVAAGTVKRFENFPSGYVTPRTVDVWLPDGYAATEKYAVLYMHDGQMLFDSTSTWNGQEWQADETLGRLLSSGKIRPCIVVGIWNTAARFIEYCPQKALESLPGALQDSFRTQFRARTLPENTGADNYLRFLTSELKPFIDSVFSVKKDPENTFVAGSSMGGLISMYALCEYPGVYGGAACLSTHWSGFFTAEDNPLAQAFLAYFRAHLPAPGAHKFYFDHGTVNLDGWYAPFQEKADVALREAGYTPKNWQTRVFAGEDHTERCWAKRLEIPLLFLLGR